MKLENQVCTYEQAQKLKNFGILQQSLTAYVIQDKRLAVDLHTAFEWGPGKVAAFNVAELAVMLPDDYYESHRGPSKDYWYCGHIESDDFHFESTQAKVMASMLIELLEKECTNVADVNARLIQS
jgi:hypothetical protein